MRPFEFARDVFSRDGFTLLVDGQSQSHVDPGEPGRLFFEYVRRIGNVIDAFRIPGAPIRALHLGGGGLSLPRYVEATRPGSSQVVVEHDGAMLDAVLARVPLPRDADLELVVADARDAVAHRSDANADLVIVDLYTGLDPPAFVASSAFAADVLAALAPDGLVVVNVADAAGLARLGAQARAFVRNAPTAELLVAGAPAILAGAEDGNAILVVAPGGLPADLERRLAAAGPHPAGVLTRDRLDVVLWGSC
ncbi:spermidine synthase [Agromyces silvae]|uniref:spermidine synthase n=1 Tax=Agromyces silvae TaxID=3388266 RepID=UPI00280AD5C0|nr:fused MFS/spermidine synthase [Agromyces protaetiae]